MKHKNINLFAFIPVLLFFFTADVVTVSAGSSKIFFPRDRIIVTNTILRVTGNTDTISESVNISLKNKTGTTKLVMTSNGNVFTGLIELQPGINEIQMVPVSGKSELRTVFLKTKNSHEKSPSGFVEYFLHSSDEITETCSGCHLTEDQRPPVYDQIEQKISCSTDKCHSGFGKAKSIHYNRQKKGCFGCHFPHGTKNKNFLKAVRLELCLSCHKSLESELQKEYTHYSFVEGDCTDCHSPHQEDQEFQLKRKTISGLCSGCHGDSFEKSTYKHELVESGGCIACHAPHASDFKKLLYNTHNETCIQCHKELKEEFERKYVHGPVTKDCLLCHAPHGSEMPFHLRTPTDEKGKPFLSDKPYNDFCLLCHKKINPVIYGQIKGSKFPHKPVKEEKCNVCHSAHTSDSPKLMKIPWAQRCYTCHKEMEKHITESLYKHGPIQNSDCYQCHATHGAQYPKLLVSQYVVATPDVFGFSGQENAPNYDLCFNCHLDKVINDQISLETSFRDGNHNLHFMHIKQKNYSCNACHDTHASSQNNHIIKEYKVNMFGNTTVRPLDFTKNIDGGTCTVMCHMDGGNTREYNRKNPVKPR